MSKCPVHDDEDLVCAVAADMESSLLSKQISQRDERIKELEKDLKERSDMLEKHWAERDPAILRDAKTIADLERLLATERDNFGKREIELMQENSVMKEALKQIEDMGTNSYVDPDTNLWEKQVTREAEISTDALSKVSKP